MKMTAEEAQKLSRMLFEAREIADMYFDVVKSQTGKEDNWLKDTIQEVDTFRAGLGWDKDGFGSEGEVLS